MAVEGEGKPVASVSPRAVEASSSGPGGKRRVLPRDVEPSSSSSAMAVKGQQVTSDLPRTIKASGSGPGGKRRGPDRDAEPSSSPAAAKRRRRAGVLQSDDAAARVSDEGEEEGEDLESEEDLDDGGAGISETQGSV